MDEFGSSIRHNDQPTVEMAPFFYLPTQTMYSIMWPVKNLSKGGNNRLLIINLNKFNLS